MTDKALLDGYKTAKKNYQDKSFKQYRPSVQLSKKDKVNNIRNNEVRGDELYDYIDDMKFFD